MSQAEAAQMAGWVGFAGSQIFGKTGTANMWHLRRRAAGKSMTPLLACSLSAWCEALSTALPRYVLLSTSSPPILLFTDGFCDACSDAKAGIGAVLVDGCKSEYEAFALVLLPNVADALRRSVGSGQIVGQTEVLVVVAAKERWRRQFAADGGRRATVFIDSDSARFGLIKGYSPSLASAWPLAEHWRHDLAWFDRFPTHCNPADGPCRVNSTLSGAKISVVDLPDFMEAMLERMWKVGD